MMNTELILSENGINKTKFRTDLLNLFYLTKGSLSVEDILNKFKKSINKVTVYRCLKSFEEKGLIHEVPDNNNLIRFALCNNKECDAKSHNHNHSHFLCSSCNQTFCLDSVKIPDINCIKGFFVRQVKLNIEGLCQNCFKN